MKTAIVTGAYGAIGNAIAKGIAQDLDFRVLMVGREANRISEAAHEMSRLTGNSNVIPVLIDLSMYSSIKKFASSLAWPIDVLVNNAATAPRQRVESAEGIEMQWAVNVLSYLRMINSLKDALHKSGKGRIVNIASYWAGGLDLSDPEFKKRAYDNDEAYRQSKQVNRMTTRLFAGELSMLHITINACHPGDVNSKLSNDLGFGGHQTPEQGAETPLWLALSPSVQGVTGKYFENRIEQTCSFMSDTKQANGLSNLINKHYEL